MSMITAFRGLRTLRFLWDIFYMSCIKLRLCSKKNGRELGALNLWNPGCQA